MNKGKLLHAILVTSLIVPGFNAQAQDARARWETMNLIRREKFDIVLPKVMRENGIDMWTEKPLRYQLELRPTRLFAFEFFMYVPLPEWGGKKLRIGIEDDVIITENGLEWLCPEIERILLIR